MANTAVLIYGRFNPPGIGHEYLIKSAQKFSKKIGAQVYVYLSSTQDKNKNPISPNDKLNLVKKIFPYPGISYRLAKNNNIIETLKEIHTQGYTELYFLVGTDRTSDMKKVLQYSMSQIGFDKAEVVSVGNRESTDKILSASATQLRNFAKRNRLDRFTDLLPYSARPMAAQIMMMVRRGMGLN